MHRHVKCIVRPERTVEALSPHHFRFAAGAVAVAETGRPVTGPLSPEISVARLRINHYFTRSLEEAEAKRLRGRADTAEVRSPEEIAAHDRGEVEDLTIRRFVPLLRTRLPLPAGEESDEAGILAPHRLEGDLSLAPEPPPEAAEPLKVSIIMPTAARAA